MKDFLTIGTYDGVHLGHRRIISAVAAAARRGGMRSRVVFFPEAPKFFFSGEKEGCLITLPSERRRLLLGLGIDAVEELLFDRGLASMSADDFFSGVVLRRFNAGGLCVGPDFAVGRGRQGHSDFLAGACAKAGLAFKKMSFLTRGGHRISSSLIRARLRAGNVEEANRCLGWNYSVSGPVLRGAGIGRRIGFPTANVGADPAKILPPGIYAARARLGPEVFSAVVNVGRRPTVGTLGGRVLLEAHLLDFDRMIYGRRLEVEFLGHIRPERKFVSPLALVAHIKKDIAAARRFLAKL